MAQKTGKEETEFKVTETLTLCVNNCGGFTVNPATNNMCQKCLKSTFSGKESPRSSSVRAPEKVDSPPETSDQDLVVPTVIVSQELAPAVVVAKKEVNRCSGCRRKVGLTGFRCRCGDLFCSEHRYSDRHECSYDYKAAGREAIARENPMVKPAKIVRV